jgi:hypothetical protein
VNRRSAWSSTLPLWLEPLKGEAIMAASKEIVPVDQGVLRASADAVGIQVDRTDSTVTILMGYGGAASAYSIIQHETPPEVFSHAPGRSWKYLEYPALDAVNGMEARLASVISSAVQGGAA